MNSQPGKNAVKIAAVLNGWESVRPGKSFAGLTLDQFKLAIKPSLDKRQALTTAANQIIALQDERDDADQASLEAVQKVVNAVVGDPAEGPDGELYEAMGYVRKSSRSSGLTRKKTNTTPTK